jgi:hypothetical protein
MQMQMQMQMQNMQDIQRETRGFQMELESV